MPRIDLKELATRESEQVEWKENVADIDDVISTAVAFANDISNLGGGYIVCGAREAKDEHGFQKMLTPGLSASRLKELEGRVIQGCRDRVDPSIVPVVEELPAEAPDKRILVFIVPATPYAHSFRKHGKDASTYYIRVSRETNEAKNGLLRELLIKKHAQERWDRRPNPTARVEDLDAVLLRDYLQRMTLWEANKAFEDYLEHPLAALALPLCAREPLTGTLRPRNFAILMFGRQIQRFFPGAYAIFSLYPGVDRAEPYAERIHLDGTIIEQADKLIDRLNTQAYDVIDKTRETSNLLRFPQRALQEAVINALVHRDYESEQPVRVTVFSDRIEIYSPGSLPTAVDRERFKQGRSAPVWRNQALAYFFNKLQLAQAEGQGIPTILRTMKETGCPNPTFDISPESVLCTLPAHPRHALIRAIREIERDLVLNHTTEAATKARELLEQDPYNFRMLELFCHASNMHGTPRDVYNFIREKSIDIEKLSAPGCLVLAETILAIKDASDEVRDLARQLLRSIAKGQYQEEEARKIALSLRKADDNEGAIAFINDTIKSSPHLQNNSKLHQLRGEAQIDLAKRCLKTATNRRTPSQVRGRAWEQCRDYLTQAERDLHIALENCRFPSDRQYIEQDINYLAQQKRRAFGGAFKRKH
jgi:ATP-dependent DNA helicase RecG